jgi:phosphate starvation-inducible PhoH-like protein
MDLIEKKIKLNDIDIASLLGLNDSYLRLIDNKFETLITVRGENLVLKGDADEVKLIQKIFNEMIYILRRNGALNYEDVTTVIELVDSRPINIKKAGEIHDDGVIIYGNKEPIKAKTPKQKDYVENVKKNDLVFAIGPAGTGKTYLAVAMAVAALKKNEVNRIVLSRPAVEAGESLGFLPGDMKDKLDPYMRPLSDALFQMIPPDKLKALYEKNIIEITPLAYMRGRTLNNAFIILDEAQNATKTQMKMFLTRFGHGSKSIVTGDVTQIDLSDKSNSGLAHAEKILNGVKSVGFSYFDAQDVVRHELVARIIRAYEKADAKKLEKKISKNNKED